ncbi:transcriptional regulator FtrA [Enterobacillus tribolii]|uniref:AraC family transcriptional regulator with amidase-like domain n=1 Tax=Enterobacillus tribolii TaxID=1487935 RepID=A0A370QHX9_9GAMM|nr:transcriptional regulator FtrA [Enterobacillus tribolii]MBW7982650.1 transcriptional regulator FtrA [Enterobacillus tribolii]RDK87929.1 AraC family transcriptional regulator with amidase-like domain [Enterobacillus tribolii]
MRSVSSLVVTLAYDGLCSFEFGISQEIFGLSRPEFDFPWYQHRIAGVDGGPMRSAGGLTFSADAGTEILAQATTIIIPGWKGIDVAPPEALLDALRAAHERGARLLSICSGAFVLAATGLLAGKRATTHWRYCDVLRRRYPAIQVDEDVLYVDNGQIITSAGSAAGIDACLHLVSRDYGAGVANRVARRLVMAPHRSGGQRQFIPQPVTPGGRDMLAGLLDKVQGSLDQHWNVAQLAAEMHMSERTFLRHFSRATGQTPKQWLSQARIARACEWLESGRRIDDVALACGFQTTEGFRQLFRQSTGITPSAYRRRFGPPE